MMQLKYELLTSQAYLKSIFFLSFSLTISPLNGPNNDPCLTSAVHQAPTERQDVCLYTLVYVKMQVMYFFCNVTTLIPT